MNNVVSINFVQDIDFQSCNNLIKLVEKLPSNSTLRININSLGGTVSAGIAMYNYLKSKEITVWTHNLGDVQSAAILLYLAGTKRTAEAISKFVIHPIKLNNVTNCTFHEAEELLETLKADIQNYASVVKKECPKIIDIDDYLTIRSQVFFPDQAQVLGVISKD